MFLVRVKVLSCTCTIGNAAECQTRHMGMPSIRGGGEPGDQRAADGGKKKKESEREKQNASLIRKAVCTQAHSWKQKRGREERDSEEGEGERKVRGEREREKERKRERRMENMQLITSNFVQHAETTTFP